MESPDVRPASCAPSDGGPSISRLDALVNITETFFKPDHSLAVRGEAEVPRFDDPGMNRSDRDLMQAWTFYRTELVRRR